MTNVLYQTGLALASLAMLANASVNAVDDSTLIPIGASLAIALIAWRVARRVTHAERDIKEMKDRNAQALKKIEDLERLYGRRHKTRPPRHDTSFDL